MSTVAPAALTFDEAKHEYRVGGIRLPSVTEILEAVGVIDYSYLPMSTRDWALERGSNVHLATQLNDEGDLDESTLGELEPYVAAWRQFKAETGFFHTAFEQRVHSQKFGYAGTLDRIGRIQGQDALVDIKTTRAEKWVRLQTAAYTGTFDEPRRYLRGSIELHADGTYRAIWFPSGDFQRDFAQFLACLTVYQLQAECGVRSKRRERAA